MFESFPHPELVHTLAITQVHSHTDLVPGRVRVRVRVSVRAKVGVRVRVTVRVEGGRFGSGLGLE